ncbi:MAG: lytic transglycosylase domain-containing protein [Bryobacterales bacterium]|nr:lytic transglycosylase domain-containing protein [Bryobacterales bacterium]
MQQRFGWRLLASLLIVSAASRADTVVLRSGYRLTVQGYEANGRAVRLLMPNGGWIAVPQAEVDRIEADPAPQPPAERPAAVDRAAPGGPEPLAAAVERLAAAAGLPAELVRAVIWAESGFQQEAVSAKGAVGLMQLMPGTAAELGVDPRDAAQNLQGGTAYLRQMLERFEGHQDQLVKALAAYNAGPGQVAKHDGMPPFPETAAYVRRVLRRYLADSAQPAASPGQGTPAVELSETPPAN